MNPDAPGRVLVLGIGNILWADEGFGVRAAEALHEAWELPPQVSVVDGGTQGLGLLPWVEDADTLLVLDAVDYGLSPGTLCTVDDDEVPRYLSAKKMSLHQTSFQDVLGLAALHGRVPSRMRLIGAQPAELDDYGGSLSPLLQACVQPAVREALRFLAGLGLPARARSGGGAPALAPPSVALRAYESGRPGDAEPGR